MNQILKYPRTAHIIGSQLQKNDKKAIINFSFLKDKPIIIEEKVDGANSGISFYDEELYLQSRGRYLTGGFRERHFDKFKYFAGLHISDLYKLLGEKYIMYGEWMSSLHSIYYDILPSYFLEFDIYDKDKRVFLATLERQSLLKDYPFIESVPIVYTANKFDLKFEKFKSFINQSKFISNDHLNSLRQAIKFKKLNYVKFIKKIDQTNLAEGLYVKWEEKGIVKGRYKYVRQSFTQIVNDSNEHWLNRPIVLNKLK